MSTISSGHQHKVFGDVDGQTDRQIDSFLNTLGEKERSNFFEIWKKFLYRRRERDEGTLGRENTHTDKERCKILWR